MVWILWYIFWSLPSFPSELLPLALWVLHGLTPGCSSFPNGSQTLMVIQPHHHPRRPSNISSHSYLRIFPLLLFFQERSPHRHRFVWLMSSTPSLRRSYCSLIGVIPPPTLLTAPATLCPHLDWSLLSRNIVIPSSVCGLPYPFLPPDCRALHCLVHSASHHRNSTVPGLRSGSRTSLFCEWPRSVICCIVVQLPRCVRLFATPWTAAHQASLPLTISWSLPRFVSITPVMPSSHLILWCLLLFLPSIFPRIRDFSNESAVRIRWPNSGVSTLASVLPLSFQGWFPLRSTGLISLLSKGLSEVFSSTTVQRHQFFTARPSLLVLQIL